MKKAGLLSVLPLMAIGAVTLTSCNKTESVMTITVVTDSGTISDQGFNQSTYEGAIDFMNDHEDGLINVNYLPPQDNTAARVASIESAINAGADIVALPGFLFQSAIYQVQDRFEDTLFLAVDCDPVDDDNGNAPYTYTPNVISLKYAEEIVGWLAGYSLVMDGYTSLGFTGGMPVPAVVKYGQGYLQGAQYAAEQMNLADNAITIKYRYAGSFTPTEEATQIATTWYDEGTEVNFACGGSILDSVLGGANSHNNKVGTAEAKIFGVDVDQAHISPLIINSAMKNIRGSVHQYLTEVWDTHTETTDEEGVVTYNFAWPSDVAGSTVINDIQNDGVGLATADESWRFNTFTTEDYNAVVEELKSGSIEIKIIENTDNHIPAEDESLSKLDVLYQS